MTKKKTFDAPYGIETRAYGCELETRDKEDGGEETVVRGKPIVFNSRTSIGDMWDEEIDPHALDNADLKDVMLLVNHDRNGIPLARSRNNNENSSMQLTVDNDGLNIRANIDPKNPKGAELLSAISRGDITGMSFAFVVNRDEWTGLDTEKPLRRITDIGKVIEVSAVNQPAYEATEISCRSLDNAKAELESLKEKDNALRNTIKLRAEIRKNLRG